MSSMGDKIKRQRQILGWKQHELARRVGVSRPTVSQWEKSRQVPLQHIHKLEDVLGISLAGDDPGNVLSPAARALVRRDMRDRDLPPEAAERVIRLAEEIAAGRRGQELDG